ncbi:hypothetical protein HA402_002416 [Bradysia odoriphaga]|nr:hypothetical protein HA402_002416 [Bradysia odoriphaga]
MSRLDFDSVQGKLLAVIAEEDICVGFVLAGIGQVNPNFERNFFPVTNATTDCEIRDVFKRFLLRDDIHIIVIDQLNAGRIRSDITAYNKKIPAILEIPSKYMPYDLDKDPIYNIAKRVNMDD